MFNLFGNKNNKLVMTILARDEVDIIEDMIEFHFAKGIDFFIFTDNGSIDGTREIFQKYVERGIGHIIDEPGRDKQQNVWVDRMNRLAIEKYKADWIINADADEFWFTQENSLKDCLPKSSNILFVPYYDFFILNRNAGKSFFHNNFRSVNNVAFKVMYKAKYFGAIHYGNHNVDFKKRKKRRESRPDNIKIYHFPFRSYEQVLHRYEITCAALQKNNNLNPNYVKTNLDYYEKLKDRNYFNEQYVLDESKCTQKIKNNEGLYDDNLINFMQNSKYSL